MLILSYSAKKGNGKFYFHKMKNLKRQMKKAPKTAEEKAELWKGYQMPGL